MTHSRIALVTGATGAIGPALVAGLLESGYQVRTLSRQTPISTVTDSSIEQFSGAISDPQVVATALMGIDTVFHLAALLHIENPSPDMSSEYQRVNVDGTRLLAEHAAQSGVRRFLYFSTVKVYGRHQQQPVTELQPPNPVTIYARSKYEGEQAVHSINGLNTVTLRLSLVYGPRMKGSWARLIHAIERGRFLPIGSLRNVHSLTHVDDVVHAAIIAAEQPDAVGEIFNVVGHENPTMYQILTAIYTAHGRHLPRIHIPSPLAHVGAFALEQGLPFLGKQAPLTRDSLRQLIDDEAYSGLKLRGLGFDPQVPISEGWATV